MSKSTSINLSALYNDVSSVTSQAVINRLRLKNPSLRAFLQNEFKPQFGHGSDFLASPVLEATFGWQPAGKKYDLTYLKNNQFLASSLVDNLSTPPMPAPESASERAEYVEKGISQHRWCDDIQEDYTWPLNRPPYQHQLDAWNHLADEKVKSVVVTSGTGSGKTECFLVPILNDLARQAETSRADLVGVQALFLYPLNALINSQRERLSAWTRGFDGKVKFSLYNGETEKSDTTAAMRAKAKSRPEMLQYRKQIWDTPPSLLVTNATMLEYMLVRQEDQPLLQKSQGKLKWIVLDEAHSYVGSQAAEVSLLLRRVMHAFGVQPENVRFIATSATIGDKNEQEETNRKLQKFLADLAGVSSDQVEVVNGSRLVPSIPEEGNSLTFNAESAKCMSSAALFDYLVQYPTLRHLRTTLTQKPLTLKEITEIIWPEKNNVSVSDQKKALELIDLATTAYPNGDNKGSQAFLPVRAHIFHRSQKGLWACIDPKCCYKENTPLDLDWEFGMVYTDEKVRCQEKCGAPVYELTHCADCNTPSLAAVKVTGEDGVKFIENRDADLTDDYADEVEGDSEELEVIPEREVEANVQLFGQSLANGNNHNKEGCTPVFLDVENRRMHNDYIDNSLAVYYNQNERGDGIRCACCNKVENMAGTTFKRAMLGSPFLMGSIVPAMLRHIPSDNPYDMKGKRLITFTDSRQGTARFSAKLQLDSERNHVRGWVYSQVLKQLGSITIPAALQGQIDLIAALKSVPENAIAVETMQRLIDDQLNKLTPKYPTWKELVSQLSKTPMVQLLSGSVLDGLDDFAYDKKLEMLPGEYRNKSELLEDPEHLANLFLLREFSRRPKMQNSMESMGLIALHYPKIQLLQSDDLSSQWKALGFTLGDWKDYLKICLDFWIRENTFVEIEPAYCNWMGAKIMPRLIQSADFKFLPDDLEAKKAIRKWPTINNGSQHRIVRLLEITSGRAAKDNESLFKPILEHAWYTLTKKTGLLSLVEREKFSQDSGVIAGYQLKFSGNVEFKTIDNGWICPVTKRWLDVTFKNLTPYLPNNATLAEATCEPMSISLPPAELYSDDTKQKLVTWLDEDKRTNELKVKGYWSDINDAVIKGIPLIRASEHSAQQSSKNLQEFEKAFKKDHLNVLSCSTTMEMGVDIGSLSMVAMNNVPPGPANYLQRAGRAGRRQEATAIALTFCKSTPHGERVFKNPKWPFETPINVPKVSLDSAAIVQRHINAFLLANYLKSISSNKKDSVLKMQTAAFFKDNGARSRAELFILWCQDDALKIGSVIAGLASLKYKSAFASYDDRALINYAVAAMEYSKDHWLSEYDALANQLDVVDNDRDGAKGKLDKQLKRLEKNYLLSELAATSYLPGYGFPTGVVSLITNNRSEKKYNTKNENKNNQQAYPSRSLDVALREYAPGSEVVVNGVVYRSQGLQLNWKMPFGENDIKEEQLLSHLWECNKCAMIGYEPNSENKKGLRCSECCSGDLSWSEYIVPTGFVVDYNTPLHNNYTQPNYSAYKEGKIAVSDCDWLQLSNPSLGRFKASENGNIFHHNDGHGAGYALCWCCGKAEALEVEKPNSPIVKGEPKLLKRHRRIQGTKVSDSHYCESTDQSWSIKRSQVNSSDNKVVEPFILGYPQTTGIFELQLRNPNDGVWITDNKLLYTLGAALRQLLCESRGITTQEIGITVRDRIAEHDEQVASLFMFDQASQGAGFSTSCPEIFESLMHKLPEYLDHCVQDCEAACHACLLDYDTQHHIKNLDRKHLSEFLKNTGFVDKLRLPSELAFFGNDSAAEMLTAKQVLNQQANNVSCVDFYILSDDWNWPEWDIKNIIKSLVGAGKKVRIILDVVARDSITPDLAWMIQKNLTDDVKWFVLDSIPQLHGSGVPLISLHKDGLEIVYGTASLNNNRANENWSTAENGTLVRSGEGYKITNQMKALDIESIAKRSELVSPGVSVIENIDTKVDVYIDDFGHDLLTLIEDEFKALSDRLSCGIERAEYFDKYVVSPLSVYLIVDFISAINDKYGQFSTTITTAEPKQPLYGRKPYCVADNFNDDGILPSFVSALARTLKVDVSCDLDDPRNLPHSRSLVLNLKNGEQLKIIFDQGMGFWSTRSPYANKRFSFDAHLDDQITEIESWNFNVKSANHDSYIVVT